MTLFFTFLVSTFTEQDQTANFMEHNNNAHGIVNLGYENKVQVGADYMQNYCSHG
jgi:hypothetical protein